MNRIQELKERVMDMFLRYGIKSVSMDDISRELGMSKKTLYQLVSDKNQLVRTVLSNIFEKEVEFCNFTQTNSNNAIEELLLVEEHVTEIFMKVSPTTMYDLAKYYKEVWKLLESKREKLIQDFFEENIKRGKKEGLYRSDIREVHIGEIYLSVVTMITDRQKNTRTDVPDVGLYRTYIDYHIRAIVTPAGLVTYKDYLKHNTSKA